MDKLSTLEIIGLAFVAGIKISEIAEEVEEKEEDNKENVIVKKIEGEDAKKFISFIEKELNNKEEK